ncbi:hypothetical protein COU78_02055 [Candidatus Peregrinibacteria bacterium CG10_big_fil_rev_8_21_14_0_10_49_24]|nr:MAG: hypothetical protein COV83_03655 [Candidatus Peregrinibacteria bacterium CG11_big_fil_rev_8_21_14_0_20_49_14]PIR51262.1 MAG: hypothetical protein COU78_02055 [Candidatus Peregrinibacteria bacterium CG10_big_fil_rev_8_21_14_0_10_49_24]PJA68070.1 MAG: hypothetical protein CO157_00820 [Candidatus Peregrinibacteria bacterium CG_4_9_14_3_um_filter_49_12]
MSKKQHQHFRISPAGTLCIALGTAAAISVHHAPIQGQSSSEPNTHRIESVQFADDFGTAIVTLREPPATVLSILYEIYHKGDTRILSAGSALIGSKTLSITQFRKYFEVPTETGIFTVRMAACPRELHLLHSGIDPLKCGISFTQQVIFAPTGTVCGNKKLETGEECDDGNKITGDGCSSACIVEKREQSVCGNLRCEKGEHKENCAQDCPDVPVGASCNDTDGGIHYEKKGTVASPYGDRKFGEDFCMGDPIVGGSALHEFFCKEDTVTFAIVDCEYGCEAGACLPKPQVVCGNGVCETGEADTTESGGCPAGSPPECLGPPARFVPGSCPSDCRVATLCGDGICQAEERELRCPACPFNVSSDQCKCVYECPNDCGIPVVRSSPPEEDPCTYMDCVNGCENGNCIVSEDMCLVMDCTYGCENSTCLPKPRQTCEQKFCPFGCKDGQCLALESTCDPYVCADKSVYPRCNPDGAPISYYVNPCSPQSKFCKSSDECKNGMTCTVELGDCMPDPACPECNVCAGVCILTGNNTSNIGTPPDTPAVIYGIIPDSARSKRTLPDPSQNWFADTALDTEVDKAANLLRDIGVIGGYSDGTFRKSSPVIRAEAAKFLLGAKYGEFPNTNNSGRFPDVEDGQWYVKYVIGAANLGIIRGYPDGTFRPGATVNTAEFLKMIAETFDLETGLPYYYADVPTDSWYAIYVGIAERQNLFPTRIEKLEPERLLTRGEVAEAIARVLMFTAQ